MTITRLHASLLALALFSAAGNATEPAKDPLLLLAQAETEAPAQDFEAVIKFLAATRDVSKLSPDRLEQRLNRARKLQNTEGLPPDLADQLQQTVAALEAEIASRQQAAPAEPPAVEQPQPPAPEVAQDTPQPPAPEVAQEEAPPPQPEAAPRGSAEVDAFLQSVRPAGELSADELRQQLGRASELAQGEDLSKQQRRDLRDVIRESRAALKSLTDNAAAADQQAPAAEQQPEPPAPEVAQQPQPEAQPTGSAEAEAFLQSVRPAGELDADQLREQLRRASEIAKSEDLSKNQRRALRDVIREARAALKTQSETAGEPQPPVTEQPPPAVAEQPQAPAAEQQQAPVAEQQQIQQPQVDPAIEAQARAILDDKVDVQNMERRELRKRLGTMRELLATNQLSPETRDALRARLAEDRKVLRAEVRAKEEAQTAAEQPADAPAKAPEQTQQQPQPQPQQGNTTVTNTNTNVVVNNNTTITNTQIQVALNDRRPPDELDDAELLRRIDVYREVVGDDRYDDAEREAWRRALERDRRYLRRQMLEERRAREEQLSSGQFQLNVQIGDDYDPNYDVPDDVFAAEVDDQELTDVLVAPPRRKVERRYTVDEIERSSQARAAVARIEIDTVHFGFGEGFLREEEIDKLDRIAQILEKILAKNPEEVFLLEGHTDAVGSDASNLVLSRQRAAAVKEALVTYYVIPAENLKTVGLGERYLKIPTLQAEAENRRVSLARITPLVGRAD